MEVPYWLWFSVCFFAGTGIYRFCELFYQLYRRLK